MISGCNDPLLISAIIGLALIPVKPVPQMTIYWCTGFETKELQPQQDEINWEQWWGVRQRLLQAADPTAAA